MAMTADEREAFEKLKAEWAQVVGAECEADAQRRDAERRERLTKLLGREPTLAEELNELQRELVAIGTK